MIRLTTFLFLALLSAPLLSADKSFFFTVDMNKLLRATDYGKNIIYVSGLERKSLQIENQKLEAELLLEEKKLSELRKTLSSDEFRPKAVEFDKRVTVIRSEQSQKEQMMISKARETEANFFKKVYPLLYELLSDRGGVLLIDQRNVVLWDSSVDLTEDAVNLINQVFGKGTEVIEELIE